MLHSLICADHWNLFFLNGMDKGEIVGIPTGDVTQMKSFEEFFDAYKKQMEYCISLLKCR